MMMCCARPKIVDGEWCSACGAVVESMLDACPECRGRNVATDSFTGSVLCTDCGRVIETCSMIFDHAAASEIDNESDDIGTVISGHLHKYQQHMDYRQRALYAVFADMSKICGEMRLPETVISQAKEMYRDLKEARISRGAVHKALIASCVYYACKVQRQEGLSRSRAAIGAAFGVDEKAMSVACKLFKDVTKDKSYHAACFDTMHTTDIVHRVMGSFQFQRDTRMRVMRSVRNLDDAVRASGVLDGKSPCSILAAILCVVFEKMKIDVPKKIVAERCDTSVVTLNKILTLLKNTS
jgi:transcription initiation factor TFIIB